MALAGKHLFGEIEGQRVTFIEKKVDSSRKDFLEKLLKHNGLEVIIKEEKPKTEEEPMLYTVAVTDMIFNPTVWVFERKLKTFDGHIVNLAYWNQETTQDNSPQYWE